VRHIHSPGSLRSGGPGVEGDHQMWEHRRCDISAIEFWVRWMPRLRRLLFRRHPVTLRKCCAFPWGYGYAAP